MRAVRDEALELRRSTVVLLFNWLGLNELEYRLVGLLAAQQLGNRLGGELRDGHRKNGMMGR